MFDAWGMSLLTKRDDVYISNETLLNNTNILISQSFPQLLLLRSVLPHSQIPVPIEENYGSSTDALKGWTKPPVVTTGKLLIEEW